MSGIVTSVTGTNAITREGIEDGKYCAHTTFHDDKSLDQNKRIRNSGMLDNSKLGLHENEDIRCVLSIPSTLQYGIWKNKFPDAYKLLTSKDESDRMKGARMMKITHPSWVVFDRL